MKKEWKRQQHQLIRASRKFKKTWDLCMSNANTNSSSGNNYHSFNTEANEI